MAFVQRDFIGPAMMFRNMYFAIYRTFKKVFPEKTVDGNLVYNNQLNLYSNGQVTTDPQVKRFLNKLGFQYQTLVEQDYEGVKRLYMTFDSNKYNYAVQDKADLLLELQNRFNVDDVFSIKITYGGNSLRYFTDHTAIINDINYFVAKLDSDPILYYSNIDKLTNETTNYSPINSNTQTKSSGTPPLALKCENADWESFALLDNGEHFERTNIRAVKLKTRNTGINGKLVEEISFIYDYKVIKQPNTTTSVLINNLDQISNSIEQAQNSTSPFNLQLNKFRSSSNSLIKNALISLQPYDDTLFYQDYLRVDAVSAMKKSEFVNVLSKVIKIDYEEEDTEWWETALMVLLVVVASIIAFPVGAAATGTLLAGQIAISLATFSTVLSVGLMAISAISSSGNLGTVGRLIGKVAQFTGIAASILGVYAAIRAVITQIASNVSGLTLNQVATAANGVNNLYSTYENMNTNDDMTQEANDYEMPNSGDMAVFTEAFYENDALTMMDMKIESAKGGSMTEALVNNQTR